MDEGTITASPRARFRTSLCNTRSLAVAYLSIPGLSDGLKKDAEGALKTAVELLGVAASMTQNVPYLGIISGALTELLKIQNVRSSPLDQSSAGLKCRTGSRHT